MAKAMKVPEPTKETKTAEELAAMIRRASSLNQHCPRGFTVFGRATGAGPIKAAGKTARFNMEKK